MISTLLSKFEIYLHGAPPKFIAGCDRHEARPAMKV